MQINVSIYINTFLDQAFVIYEQIMKLLYGWQCQDSGFFDKATIEHEAAFKYYSWHAVLVFMQD